MGNVIANNDMPRSFLFVGGPLDGQVRDVPSPGRRHYIQVFDSRGVPAVPPAPGQKISTEQAEYILEPIHVEGGKIVLHFYRYASMREAEAVLRLMAAYADKSK